MFYVGGIPTPVGQIVRKTSHDKESTCSVRGGRDTPYDENLRLGFMLGGGIWFCLQVCLEERAAAAATRREGELRAASLLAEIEANKKAMHAAQAQVRPLLRYQDRLHHDLLCSSRSGLCMPSSICPSTPCTPSCISECALEVVMGDRLVR